MSAPLDVGVIDAAVDVLVTGGWVQGTLETADGRHCAHGAVLSAACTPGDAVLWQSVMRYSGLTEEWNDEPGRTADEVSERLTAIRDVTAEDMVEVFGPNWMAVRDLVRRAAKLTDEEATALCAARDTARDAVGDTVGDTAVAAAMAARAAAVSAGNTAAATAWVAWDTGLDTAWVAWSAAWDAAWDTAAAVAARDHLITTDEGARHYATLTGPWATVIGPAHPDDTTEVSDG